MNAQVENQNSMLDRLKWLFVGILLLAGIIANYHFGNQPVSLKIAGWVVLICMIAGVVFQTSQGRKLWEFIQESRMELRKVVWPSREETIKTTLLIIATVTIASLIFWGVDSILLVLVGILTGQRGW